MILFADGQVREAGGTPRLEAADRANAVRVAATEDLTGVVKADGSVVIVGGGNTLRPPTDLAAAKELAFSTRNNPYQFAVAIRGDGTPAVWGTFPTDNAVDGIPTEAKNLTAIAAGFGHVVARRADGTVACWGNNQNGQCTPPAGLAGVLKVDADRNASVALTLTGRVHVWGGTSDQREVPNDALSGVTDISARDGLIAALRADGSVLFWGTAPTTSYTVDSLRETVGRLRGVGFLADGGQTVIAPGPIVGAIHPEPVRVEPYDPEFPNTEWHLQVAGSVTLTNEVASLVPFSGRWLFNGQPIPGATGTALTLTPLAYTNRGNYQFVAEAANGSVSASARYKLNVTAGNDDFANARVLPAVGGTFSDLPGIVTREPGEPFHAGGVGPTLWYQWTASASVWVRLETDDAGMGLDTVLAVYTGADLARLSLVVADDDSGADGEMSLVAFRAIAGETYRIAVGGYSRRGDLPSAFNILGNHLLIRLTFLDPVLLPVAASAQDFTFSLAAPPESEQVVEASQDLRTWSPVSTNRVPVAGLLPFAASISTDSAGSWFFRIRQ